MDSASQRNYGKYKKRSRGGVYRGGWWLYTNGMKLDLGRGHTFRALL